MWRKLIVGFVLVVASFSVLLGLTEPDGKVDDSPATVTESTPPPPERSPVEVSSAAPWPGLPDGIGIDESTGSVNWCDGAKLEPATGPAADFFGPAKVDEAYCDALSFMFEQHYSSLAVPRESYEVSDFSSLRDWLTADAYDNRFLPKAEDVIADPDNADARKELGLLLFHLSNDRPGASRLSAGPDHIFYGGGSGYDQRSVWVNPVWRRTGTELSERNGVAVLSMSMTASAALPVFNTATNRDDMLVVKTEATFEMTLRTVDSGHPWRIDGWRIVTPETSFEPLKVAE